MLTWRARGIELLILSGQRTLTPEERAEMLRLCGRAAR